ncbi:hypothetical protein BHE74_00029664 [Ensete ventricosum]|nr:hypothetical protein BHE74_00029664 [Ensete ventricosum]
MFHCPHLHWFKHEELDLFAVMFAAPRFVAMPTQLLCRSFAKLVSCQLFWCRGLDGSRGGNRPRHGWSGSDPCPSYLVVQLFFLDTWKEITAIRVYGYRAFTSPQISNFRLSIKVPKSCFSDQFLVWLGPNPAGVLSHCYPSSSLAQCHHRGRCSSPSPPTTHAAVVAVAAAFFSTYTSSITAPVPLATIVRFLPCILLGYRRQIGYPYAGNLVAPKSYYIFVVNSCP